MSTTTLPGRPVLHPIRRLPGGFTLIEVIVAIVVLTVGLLAMAGTTAHVVREVTLADITSERSAALQSVVERLQATPFANVASGTDSVGKFGLQWISALETSGSKMVTVVTTGPGLRSTAPGSFPSLGPDVVDTFEFRVINR